MRTLRQRVVLAAITFRSSIRKIARRESAAIKRHGPVHEWLSQLYLFSKRHQTSVNQWDTEYAEGDYTERLDTITHVAHHTVILGYLSYGPNEPRVLDVGCGHGRLLRLLGSLHFSEYVGMDWSAQGIERARSLSIPRTRFEVADMNDWDTVERFGAVVLDNCLSYAADPRAVFERALSWLDDDGIVIVAMYRGLGARYLWSLIDATAVEEVAGCAVKDNGTGASWDIKALRPRRGEPATRVRDTHAPSPSA